MQQFVLFSKINWVLVGERNDRHCLLSDCGQTHMYNPAIVPQEQNLIERLMYIINLIGDHLVEAFQIFVQRFILLVWRLVLLDSRRERERSQLSTWLTEVDRD